METEVESILNIINTHIGKCQAAMDAIINYELDMADCGCPISKDKSRTLDDRWTENLIIKNMLTRVRDEIYDTMN